MSSTLPEMQKAVLFRTNSESYDVIEYADIKTPQIETPSDVIIKNKYAGVNFIEAYFRKGIYPANLPTVFGREASGVVAAVGDAVTKFKVGDKVAYLSGSTFAQYTKIVEDHHSILKLDPDTSEEQLKLYGAAFTQGLTALSFIDEAYKVKKDDYILVWAAAGGVGRLLVQLISQRGAHVIAVASTEEKLQIAKELGAEYLVKSSDYVVGKVKEITNGNGVIATFDSIGKDTFEASFESLARKGTFVSYGNASGVVPPLSINRLSGKNIVILRPILGNYIATPEEWNYYSSLLVKLLRSGELKLDISKTYKLEDYKQAAIDLESRKTTGKLVLEIPQ